MVHTRFLMKTSAENTIPDYLRLEDTRQLIQGNSVYIHTVYLKFKSELIRFHQKTTKSIYNIKHKKSGKKKL